MKSELTELDLNTIEVKYSLREHVGDLGSLQRSIEKLGLLHPVLVDRNHVLISGSRRVAACRAAGLSTVRAIKLDTTFDSMSALDVLSDENLCRRALTGSELENLIQSKKALLTGKDPRGAGIFRRLKKVLTRG